MRKILFIAVSAIFCLTIDGCKQAAPSSPDTQITQDAEDTPDEAIYETAAIEVPDDLPGKVLCETDRYEIVSKTLAPATDDYDVDKVALYLRNKSTGTERLLLTTISPSDLSLNMDDEYKFNPASIDSIPAVHKVAVYNQQPLQLIVEGCPDFRNIVSFFVDVDSRKAWYVPANSGYMGATEEGYMVFRSYRYVSDPDISGRYTLLQVFDEDGTMIDFLDLEHVILEKSLRNH